MPKKTRGQPVKKDGNEYEQGYLAGLQAAFEDAELDAFYAGVGYAKHASGDKHIGFNSSREREQFENGMRNKDNHFRSYITREPTFLERLFGIQVSRRDLISSGRDKKKEERRKQLLKSVKKKWKRGKNKYGKERSGKSKDFGVRLDYKTKKSSLLKPLPSSKKQR